MSLCNTSWKGKLSRKQRKERHMQAEARKGLERENIRQAILKQLPILQLACVGEPKKYPCAVLFPVETGIVNENVPEYLRSY